MKDLIGRDSEIARIKEYMGSDRGEFVAIYGRRRVGKTYLVRKFFQNNFDFYVTGIIGGTAEEEMKVFNYALRTYGHTGEDADNWLDAFLYLATLLKQIAEKKKGERIIVFIDELPCFDTPKSRFVHALDYFWNSQGAWMDNIFFIVCGSATSWMIRNIVDNHGGLHNRITHEIHLHPFSLRTTEEYIRNRDCNWDRLSIAQLYMAIGGVPYYLSLLNFDDSVVDNIDRLFFAENAELKGEYKRLFKSLYANPEKYVQIIETLAKTKRGLTRAEIAKNLKLENNGHLSDMLEDLVNCDFIRLYNNGTRLSGGIYQLMDFYVLFYNQFCKKRISDKHYWRTMIGSTTINTWYGLAYERICMAHIDEILYALHLDTIHVEYYSWRSIKTDGGAQIDLVLDRADGINTICEIKYSKNEYMLTQEEYKKILNRQSIYQTETKTKKGVQIVMITTFGYTPNKYSEIQKRCVVLDDLFAQLHP